MRWKCCGGWWSNFYKIISLQLAQGDTSMAHLLPKIIRGVWFLPSSETDKLAGHLFRKEFDLQLRIAAPSKPRFAEENWDSWFGHGPLFGLTEAGKITVDRRTMGTWRGGDAGMSLYSSPLLVLLGDHVKDFLSSTVRSVTLRLDDAVLVSTTDISAAVDHANNKVSMPIEFRMKLAENENFIVHYMIRNIDNLIQPNFDTRAFLKIEFKQDLSISDASEIVNSLRHFFSFVLRRWVQIEAASVSVVTNGTNTIQCDVVRGWLVDSFDRSLYRRRKFIRPLFDLTHFIKIAPNGVTKWLEASSKLGRAYSAYGSAVSGRAHYVEASVLEWVRLAEACFRGLELKSASQRKPLELNDEIKEVIVAALGEDGWNRIRSSLNNSANPSLKEKISALVEFVGKQALLDTEDLPKLVSHMRDLRGKFAHVYEGLGWSNEEFEKTILGIDILNALTTAAFLKFLGVSDSEIDNSLRETGEFHKLAERYLEKGRPV